MAVREPFTEEQMQQIREAHKQCAYVRREMDRAERVGLDVSRHRRDLDNAEKTLADVIHEYGDDSRP